MFALLLLAADTPVIDFSQVVARVNAQSQFDECAQRWAKHFVMEREPAATIADTAINLCDRERQAFAAATKASMPDPQDADSWVTDRTNDIRQGVISFVLLFRSDIPTGSRPTVN